MELNTEMTVTLLMLISATVHAVVMSTGGPEQAEIACRPVLVWRSAEMATLHQENNEMIKTLQTEMDEAQLAL